MKESLLELFKNIENFRFGQRVLRVQHLHFITVSLQMTVICSLLRRRRRLKVDILSNAFQMHSDAFCVLYLQGQCVAVRVLSFRHAFYMKLRTELCSCDCVPQFRNVRA